LFPNAPKLENITDTGVENPVIDPSQTRIAYAVSSQSAQKNGIYIIDLGDRSLLTLQSNATQITDETTDLFSKARMSWSPDGQNLLATVSATRVSTYLLTTNGLNSAPSDITETTGSVEATWEKAKLEKEQSRLNSLKPTLKTFVTNNFSIIAWSPDETKILYTASQSATLPPIITPPLIGTDATMQERSIQKDNVYVYDTKEDKNFLVGETNKKFGTDYTLTWFPDSKHLIYVHDKRIAIKEYDNTNDTTVYAGPFMDTYVFPWPNATKIVILTNLNNPNISPNLYTIDLK
ncbi:MAG: hypothetical protein ACREGI_05715, partial [Candidatus Levyibacteriota bacterium]